MPKCDFKCDFALRHGCSPVNLLHIFRTPIRRNTTGWLLLKYVTTRPKLVPDLNPPLKNHFKSFQDEVANSKPVLKSVTTNPMGR